MLPIHSHKETQQYCCTISSSYRLGVVERTLGCYSDDGALGGRSWSYCDDDDREIGHVCIMAQVHRKQIIICLAAHRKICLM